jgi:hypothetical protein
MKFKQGDAVLRINKSYGSVEVGKAYVVSKDQHEEDAPVELVGQRGSYTAENFVLRRRAGEPDTVVIDQHAPGAKLDTGKVRPSLILNGMARALYAVAEVGTFGAIKYTDGGWIFVPNGFARYEDAQQRHALARAKGETHDPESKLLHLQHEAWNALAKLDLYLREQEKVKVG